MPQTNFLAIYLVIKYQNNVLNDVANFHFFHWPVKKLFSKKRGRTLLGRRRSSSAKARNKIELAILRLTIVMFSRFHFCSIQSIFRCNCHFFSAALCNYVSNFVRLLKKFSYNVGFWMMLRQQLNLIEQQTAQVYNKKNFLQSLVEF